MTLPEIAARLRVLADELACDELKQLASEIRRRQPTAKAPVQSAPVTPALRKQILDMKRANGPVDFKVSSGFLGRVLVEIKLSSNTKLVAGYNKQLERYRIGPY